MIRNTLLIAVTAGLFATGAFAQTSNGTSPDTADGASMPMKKHSMKKHSSMKSSTGMSANTSKTPAVTTGASAATENGQGQ